MKNAIAQINTLSCESNQKIVFVFQTNVAQFSTENVIEWPSVAVSNREIQDKFNVSIQFKHLEFFMHASICGNFRLLQFEHRQCDALDEEIYNFRMLIKKSIFGSKLSTEMF